MDSATAGKTSPGWTTQIWDDTHYMFKWWNALVSYTKSKTQQVWSVLRINPPCNWCGWNPIDCSGWDLYSSVLLFWQWRVVVVETWLHKGEVSSDEGMNIFFRKKQPPQRSHDTHFYVRLDDKTKTGFLDLSHYSSKQSNLICFIRQQQ